MKRRLRTERLVSAGGVVYRLNEGRVEVAVCGRTSPPIWGLPKGTPEDGESFEQTALREVREETGLEVEARAFIDTIDYWFVLSTEGVRCHKTVYFYLMSGVGGHVSLHDQEFDVVQWLTAEETLKNLTYDNERRIVENGLSLVPEKARVR